MRFYRLAPLLAIAIALQGCGNPTNAVIPTDSSKWETELATTMKKLEPEDRAKVAGYLMRAQAGAVFGAKGIPPGTTIGDAIIDQDKWEAEQTKIAAKEEALRRKLQAERDATLEKLHKAVTVTLLAKLELPRSYQAGRYSDYQEFIVGVENNSEKTVIGVAGEIKFIDIFDKEVGSVNFRISEKIEPGKVARWEGGRDYNQFIDSHKAVWNLENGKYKTKFIPETVVFADNTKFSVEQ